MQGHITEEDLADRATIQLHLNQLWEDFKLHIESELVGTTNEYIGKECDKTAHGNPGQQKVWVDYATQWGGQYQCGTRLMPESARAQNCTGQQCE